MPQNGQTSRISNISIYFCAAILIVCVNGYVLYDNIVSRRDHQVWVEHTHNVIRGLDAMNLYLKDIESNVRAYVITKDRTFTERVPDLEKKIWVQYDIVLREIKDNLDQRKSLEEAKPLLAERVKALTDAAADVEMNTYKPLTSKNIQGTKRDISVIQGLFEKMQTHELELLKVRENLVAQSERVVNYTFFASLIFNLSLLVFGFLRVRAENIRQEKALAEQVLENWHNSTLSTASEHMLNPDSTNRLATQCLDFLAKTFNFPAANFFGVNGDNLNLLATYATTDLSSGVEKSRSNEFKLKKGLLGVAATSNKIVDVANVPTDYFSISSSLGSTAPRHLLFVPIGFQNHLIGIIEIATFEQIKPEIRDLMEAIREKIGVALNAASSRERQQELLEETQRQAEELQAQQEELRTSNEELEEQTQALFKTQDSLQVQQEELQQINEELEAQTKALEKQQSVLSDNNRSLELARGEIEARAKELERINHYKSEFLAKMSHELRTPLNSMLILSALLQENKEGNLNDQQRDFAGTIQDAGKDLLNLINDILDLSKIEARKLALRPEPLSTSPFLEQLKMQFEAMMNKKGLKFKINKLSKMPENLMTDRLRLEQILRNLLSNAFKFTDEGSVELEVGPGRTSEYIKFSVTDTGTGIPENKKQSIFEAFEQADSSISRKYGGTGLGLTISREIASLLGGKISLVSAENQGSTFTLEVPITLDPSKNDDHIDQSESTRLVPTRTTRPSSEPMPELNAPAAGAQHREVLDSDVESLLSEAKLKPGQRTVLIVEDDEAFLKSVKDLARSREFLPIAVTDGESALAILKKHIPSAILLDIKLPGISGLGILEQIKQDPRLRHVPVHMMSALEHQMNAMRMGAMGYLDKPVTIGGVKEAFVKIEKVLTRQLKRVLIVEDDSNQQKAMSHLLSGPGIEIVLAKMGKEALKFLKETDFDCVIVDLSLPDISGTALLENVHAELKDNVPPIIVYTGRDLTRDEEEKLRSFSESIIIKGAKSPERLLDEVNLFLHRVETDLPEDQKTMLSELRMLERSFTGRTVLLVDDDLRNVFALTSALESKGLQVVGARNGFEALEALEKNPNFDAVLMDIMMPKMDGFEAMKRIRAQKKFQSLPIIALTAKAMKGDHEQCIAAGASDYLPKPVNLMNLISVLKAWLPNERILS